MGFGVRSVILKAFGIIFSLRKPVRSRRATFTKYGSFSSLESGTSEAEPGLGVHSAAPCSPGSSEHRPQVRPLDHLAFLLVPLRAFRQGAYFGAKVRRGQADTARSGFPLEQMKHSH